MFENIYFGGNFREIWILVTIFENSISIEIVETSRLWSNFLNNLDFGQISQSMSKCWKNLEFCQDFKFPEDVDFGQNFEKISILDKICENFKFGHFFFRKTPMFFETFRFWSKFFKNLHFGHFIINLDLCQIFENKFFGQNFRKKLDFDKKKNIYINV